MNLRPSATVVAGRVMFSQASVTHSVRGSRVYMSGPRSLSRGGYSLPLGHWTEDTHPPPSPLTTTDM